MKKLPKLFLSFAAGTIVYAALVTGYFFLVLHLLGGWLKPLFDTD